MWLIYLFWFFLMAKKSLKISSFSLLFWKNKSLTTYLCIFACTTLYIYIYIYIYHSWYMLVMRIKPWISMATSQCLGQPTTTRLYKMLFPNCYTNLNFHMHFSFIFLFTYPLTTYQNTYHLLTYLAINHFFQNMNFDKLYFDYLKEFVQLTYNEMWLCFYSYFLFT
jgi:hypothetical protein